MPVTAASIVTPLRALLRDNAGQTNNQWTDSILLGYITDGVQEARRELSLVDADYFLTIVTFSLTANQQAYAPATDIRKIVKIQRIDSGTPVVVNPITFEDSLAIDQIAGDATGDTFYMFTGTEVRIFPTPPSNVSDAIRLLYEKEIVPAGGFTTSSTTVDLPDDWIRFAIYASACNAVLQDEQNPGVLYTAKSQMLRRMRVDYRDRQKGRARYVRYISGPGDTDYAWGV